VDLDGNSEVVAHGPGGLGWSIDWLPDGRLLVTGDGLRRREPNGTLVQHVDLSALGGDWNELVVDGRGNIYVNGGISFEPGEGDPPGLIALVTPDGLVRQVADALAFPNGMVVTPDNRTLIVAESFAGKLTAFDIAADGSLSNRRTWADGLGADGICLDVDGAVWAQSGPMANACVRVREDGQCSSGSNSIGARSPACSVARTAGRSSSWRPSGAASRRWTRRSPTAPVRSWSPMRPRPAPAGPRDSTTPEYLTGSGRNRGVRCTL
jgi:hypothetical protein